MHIYHYTIVFVDKQQNKRMKNEHMIIKTREERFIYLLNKRNDTIAAYNMKPF